MQNSPHLPHASDRDRYISNRIKSGGGKGSESGGNGGSGGGGGGGFATNADAGSHGSASSWGAQYGSTGDGKLEPASDSLKQHAKPPLPRLLPARTKLPTSSSLSSPHAGSSTTASSSSLNDVPPSAVDLPSGLPSALGSTSSLSGSGSLPPRAPMTRVACEACRKRRIKCNGDRPKCAACVKNRSDCVYFSASSAETNSQALKRRLEQSEDERDVYCQLYDKLRSLPEDQVHELVRRLRMGATAASLLGQARDGEVLLRSFSVPEPRLRYEFPYRAGMPLGIQRSSFPYLSSYMYEAISAEDHLERGTGQTDEQDLKRQYRVQELARRYPPQYLRPYHAAKLVDARLDAVDVTRWTMVITDNELFVDLLSAYLLREYPGFPVFHKDTFLQALVDGDQRFCSPLLVNAIMAQACHCFHGVPNRARFWDPLTLGYRFLTEATRLWELRPLPCTLVQAQAATVLNMAYCHNGLDRIGSPYLVEAVSMGHELGIFGSEIVQDDLDLNNARLLTAWGIFRWTVAMSYYFRKPGIMKAAPELTLPTPGIQPHLYGELVVQYPLDGVSQPIALGSVFVAWSSLRTIMNDIASVAFAGPDVNTISVSRWMVFRQQLEAWFTSLIVSLSPTDIIWPVQFALHLEYHLVQIKLSRMHILDNPGDTSPSLLATARASAAESAISAITQLETVIRLYFLRHSFEYYDGFLTLSLSSLANIVMERRLNGNSNSWEPEASEHLKSTLVLCFKGLVEQAQCSYVSAVICKLLYEMQTPEDANLIRSYVDMSILHDRSAFEHKVHSAFPIEIGTADEPKTATLEDLMARHLPDSLTGHEEKRRRKDSHDWR